MPLVTHTKTCVFLDDNLAVDHQKTSEIIDKMKRIFFYEFKMMNLKTDLRPGFAKFSTRYVGWFMNLKEQALKLPADKQKTIIKKIERFVEGKLNVRTAKPKRTPFLYSGREIASLGGSLVHFAGIHHDVKPRLTPVYRLLDNFSGKTTSFKRLNITSNFWLLNSLKYIKHAVEQNNYVPFSHVAQVYGRPLATFPVYSDGAGKPSEFNLESYGIGGVCYEQRVAWQCPRNVYTPFLNQYADSRPDLEHISIEELLAQQLSKFIIMRIVGKFSSRICYECCGDNEPAQKALNKNSSKREFASALVSLSRVLANSMNCVFIHPMITSKDMEHAGADLLSRKPVETLNDIQVLKINRRMFKEFTSFFRSGTADLYINMINRVCSRRFDTE